MPRFDDRLLDCSLYLYPTERDAKAGARIGGSGFLAVVDGINAGELNTTAPERPEDTFHFYAISNRHVVKGEGTLEKPGNPVVRLNKHDGTQDIITFTVDDWVFSEEHDIAVAPISYNPANKYLFVSVVSLFLTKEIAAKKDVGIGDEVFLVGRLVHHDGKQRNSPSLRWGHISMMPSEPLYHKSNLNHEQESFVVEVHSISGYSGSPVFVRPFAGEKLWVGPLPEEDEKTRVEHARSERGLSPEIWGPPRKLSAGPWLLGVEWGIIEDNRGNNTGMAGVIPAWHLIDLLNIENLVMQRTEEQEERKNKTGGTSLTTLDN